MNVLCVRMHPQPVHHTPSQSKVAGYSKNYRTVTTLGMSRCRHCSQIQQLTAQTAAAAAAWTGCCHNQAHLHVQTSLRLYCAHCNHCWWCQLAAADAQRGMHANMQGCSCQLTSLVAYCKSICTPDGLMIVLQLMQHMQPPFCSARPAGCP